jgi:hypothetical protein
VHGPGLSEVPDEQVVAVAAGLLEAEGAGVGGQDEAAAGAARTE